MVWRQPGPVSSKASALKRPGDSFHPALLTDRFLPGVRPGQDIRGLAAGDADYVIEGSAVFNPADNDHLEITGMSAGDSNTTGTLEIVFKRSLLTSDQVLVGANNTSSSDLAYIRWESADKITIVVEPTDASTALSWAGTTQEFRDPNAWEQLVIQFDTTEAAAGDRCTIEHNGVDITANFTQTTDIGQNKTIPFCDPDSMKIGQHPANSNNDFGGYIARVSWVDGSALDATNYGEETNDGYWQINDISGLTFGTNGWLLEGGANVAAGVDSNSALTVTLEGPSDAAFADEGSNYSFVGRSVSSDIVNKATRVESAHNFAADFTVAFQPGPATTDGGHLVVGVYDIAEDGTYSVDDQTGAMSSMTASWWCERDGDVKYGSSNKDTGTFGADDTIKLKRSGSTLTWYKNDVLYHEHTDTSSATLRLVIAAGITGITHRSLRWWDSVESEGNFFTPTGTPTATNDSPTNDAENGIGNFATLNGLYVGSQPGGRTLSEGNLKWVGVRGANARASTLTTLGFPTSGKWYWEVTVGSSGTNTQVGIHSDNGSMAEDSRGVYWRGNGTDKIVGSAAGSDNWASPNTYTTSDVLSFAYDADNGYLWCRKGSTWENGASTGEVEAGTGTNAVTNTINTTDGVWFPFVRRENVAGSSTMTFNFGQSAFTQTKPAGFKTLHTANLPAPAIPDPTEHHQVELVNHDGSSTNFTANWDLDLYDWVAFIKNRDNVELWYVVDTLRGVTNYFPLNASTAETTGADVITFSGTTGTLSGDLLADNYVVELWRLGLVTDRDTTNSGTISDSGFITSLNPTSKAALTIYTGNGVDGATVDHGHSAVPNCTFIRNRTSSEVLMKHDDLTGGMTGTYLVEVSQSNAETVTMGAGWITMGATLATLVEGGANINNVNTNTETYWMFSHIAVEGYSAFGSYEGNSNADGPVINVGFLPTSQLIKNIDAVENWRTSDIVRDIYNPIYGELYPNLTDAEHTADADFDFLAPGFKIRRSAGVFNTSGQTCIYALWGGRPIQGPAPATSTSQGRAR